MARPVRNRHHSLVLKLSRFVREMVEREESRTPVKTFASMTPEERAEMERLYAKPATKGST